MGTLVLAALTASHELIYLLAHGAGAEYARAMREGGHDRYWTSFVLTVVGLTSVFAFIAVRQLRRLHQQTSMERAGRLRVHDGGLGLFARHAARLWLLVSTGTLLAFLTQENMETVTAGHALPGPDVVSGEYAVAIPVIAFVSLVVALVGGLVGWGRHVLLSRMGESLDGVPRRVPRTLRPTPVGVPASRSAVRWHGLRAPPSAIALIA